MLGRCPHAPVAVRPQLIDLQPGALQIRSVLGRIQRVPQLQVGFEYRPNDADPRHRLPIDRHYAELTHQCVPANYEPDCPCPYDIPARRRGPLVDLPRRHVLVLCRDYSFLLLRPERDGNLCLHYLPRPPRRDGPLQSLHRQLPTWRVERALLLLLGVAHYGCDEQAWRGRAMEHCDA